MLLRTIVAVALAVPTAAAQTAPASGPTPAATPQAALAPTEPVALFEAVCIGGSARLSRKWATATRYAAIPAEAQAALGLPVMSVPNPVYQINATDQYLIVPAPESAMPFRLGCAVIWKGNDLVAAQKLVPAPPETQLVVTAATTNGWTVLKSLPAPTNPQPAGVR
jgi:hypothetical protein